METLLLDGEHLSIRDVVDVARHYRPVELGPEGRSRVVGSRQVVERLLAEERPIYGISTGFGEFSRVFIAKAEREILQRNLILSHATGVGEYLPEEVVRAAMVLRANSLAKGYSGIRLETLEMLLALLNRRVHPVVPAKGSVGASGDLAPLSHIMLVLLGEGEAVIEGRRMSGREALAAVGLAPLELGGKEGLALINGTQVMTAIGALALADAVTLVKTADIAAAMSLEALRGTRTAFDARIHSVRPYRGQADCARNILVLTEDSPIMASHRDCHKVQDAYSLRCIPQVHGAVRDAVNYAANVLAVEINAATDNPLIFPSDGDVISGGNFHGEPVAMAMDFLTIALAELGSIAERRITRLMDAHLSELPPFLTAYAGVNSGLMLTQYTAAALVSENKVLAHPACVDSIPTSANQEDHVSMGTIAARKCRQVVENVAYILAIEVLAAAQGLDFLAPLKPGIGTGIAHCFIRERVPHLEEDRVLATDINTIYGLIRSGTLAEAVEGTVGPLR